MGHLIADLQAQATGHPASLLLIVAVVCFLSGFLPLINAEAFLISTSALCPLAFSLPLALAAAVGMMGGKMLLYLAGSGLMHLPLPRYRVKVEAARGRFERRRGRTGVFIFASAASGLPPFYAVSVMAGALRLDPVGFFAVGTAGRFVRFSLAVALPHLVLLLA